MLLFQEPITLLAPVVVAFAILGLTYVGKRWLPGSDGSPVTVSSCLLIAVSLWTCLVVFSSSGLPGSSGPLQYARGDALALFVFSIRAFTFLALLLIPVVSFCTLLLRLRNRRPANGFWAAVALVGYSATWILVSLRPGFMPTA